MINSNHNALNAAGYPADITQNVDQLNEANAQSFGQIMENVQLGNLTLPAVSGMEKHPYKGLLHNTDADVYLIGTFPPVSYMVDRVRSEGPGHQIAHLAQPGNGAQLGLPQIPFYHGNINGLWNVLLPNNDLLALNQAHGRAAKREYLINWLTENGIHYDDIVHYTQRSLNGRNYPFQDTALCNIRPDLDLVRRVMTRPNVRILAFVNGATFRQNGLGIHVNGARAGQIRTNNQHSDPWSWFMRTCQMSGIGMEMMCDGQFEWTSLQDLDVAQRRYKLAYRMRFTPLDGCAIDGFERPKELEVLTPYSPAAFIGVGANPVFQAMNDSFGNPGPQAVLRQVYARLRERNLDELVPFNQAI